jgi:hypothetical protein
MIGASSRFCCAVSVSDRKGESEGTEEVLQCCFRGFEVE